VSARLAAVQMSSGADVGANLRAAGGALEAARAQGAGVAVLPENFAFMGAHERDKLAVAEAEGGGPIQDFLAQAARRLGLWLVAGTVPLKTADPQRVAAACLVFDAGGARVARYDKIHLFDVDVPDGGAYRESASIAPGPAKRTGSRCCARGQSRTSAMSPHRDRSARIRAAGRPRATAWWWTPGGGYWNNARTARA